MHKPQTLVLVSDQSIAWIVNQRLDNRFKVTDKTERVLEIMLDKGNPDKGQKTD